jgi:hypothetical protein
VLRKLLNYATSGISRAIAKYAVRASVAIPFLFALGFGLAGVAVVLIDEFGYRTAYFLLAGGFTAIGAVAALVVWLKERSEVPETGNGIEASSAAAVATATIETAKQIPPAIAAGTVDASSSFRDLATMAARHWPLVLAVAIAIVVLGGSSQENRYGRSNRSRF